MRPTANAGNAIRDRFEAWTETVASLIPQRFIRTRRPLRLGNTCPLYPVSGDLCREGLAFDAATDAALRRDTEIIIHAAADTRFSGPKAEQWDANVEGTRRMLEWAARLPEAAPLHSRQQHLRRRSAHRRQIDEAAPGRAARIRQPLSVHQMGSGTVGPRIGPAGERGAHQSGHGLARDRLRSPAGALHNIIRWFGRGLVPMLPGLPDSTVDLISAETAARCLARAAAAPPPAAPNADGPANPIWHIAAGRQATPLRDLVDVVYDQFAEQSAWRRKAIPQAAIVDHNAFERLRASVDAERHPAFSQVIDAVSSFLPICSIRKPTTPPR